MKRELILIAFTTTLLACSWAYAALPTCNDRANRDLGLVHRFPVAVPPDRFRRIPEIRETQMPILQYLQDLRSRLNLVADPPFSQMVGRSAAKVVRRGVIVVISWLGVIVPEPATVF